MVGIYRDDNVTVKATRASVFMYFQAIIIYWPLYFNAFNDFTNEIDLNAVDFDTFVTYHMIFLLYFRIQNPSCMRCGNHLKLAPDTLSSLKIIWNRLKIASSKNNQDERGSEFLSGNPGYMLNSNGWILCRKSSYKYTRGYHSGTDSISHITGR